MDVDVNVSCLQAPKLESSTFCILFLQQRRRGQRLYASSASNRVRPVSTVYILRFAPVKTMISSEATPQRKKRFLGRTRRPAYSQSSGKNLADQRPHLSCQ